jgi:CDP-diacylglycerol--glycerol-3-phosphate 3-phosphatidyltransferase
MNAPNALTLSRIFLVPLLLAVLLTKDIPYNDYLAVAIVLLAAATDALDGYLARRLGQVTTLGILLDPIADKLLVSGAFIAMVEIGLVPAWMAVLIVGRELAVTGLRSIAQAGGYSIDVSQMGKTKTVVQIVAIVGLLLGVHQEWLRWPAQAALILAVVLSLYSAIQYFLTFWRNVDIQVKARRSRLHLLKALRQERRRKTTPSGVHAGSTTTRP